MSVEATIEEQAQPGALCSGALVRPSVHFSSATDEWATPRAFFDQLNAEFRFTLDPCSTHTTAKCARHYTREEDGLAHDWRGERVFMNPPYGREIAVWIRKAYESAQAGALVVCLVPARTDTAWWHDYAAKGVVRFLRGRLKFGDGKNSAPFPSAVVIFNGPNISGLPRRASDVGSDRGLGALSANTEKPPQAKS